MTFFEYAVDIFNFDGGIIDQDADSQGQSAQSHDIDRLVQQTQDDNRA